MYKMSSGFKEIENSWKAFEILQAKTEHCYQGYTQRIWERIREAVKDKRAKVQGILERVQKDR